MSAEQRGQELLVSRLFQRPCSMPRPLSLSGGPRNLRADELLGPPRAIEEFLHTSGCRLHKTKREGSKWRRYLGDLVPQLLGLGVDEDLVQELSIAAADFADIEEALDVVLGGDDGILGRGRRGERGPRARGEEGGRVGVGRGAVWR